MRIEKNKIIFSLMLVCILLFIGGYSLLVLEEDQQTNLENNQVPIPELKNDQKEYDSKLDAFKRLKRS